MHISKILIAKSGEWYYINDAAKDYHCAHGYIRCADLLKAKSGARLVTSKGTECVIFDATFADNYRKIKRGAQIIMPKDAGLILSETLVGRDSICVDAGGGSGALSCFLARYVKKVHVFDIREDHLGFVKENATRLDLKNVICKLQDVYNDIPVKNVDLITLDVPEPFRCLDHAAKALKAGGFLVCYLPCTNQVQPLIAAVEGRSDFIVIKNCELIERMWDVTSQKIRPATQGLMHTGFLTFFRRI